MHLNRMWLGVPWLLVQAAAHPTAAGQPAHPPVFGAEATLVAVPVFVTDKAGEAVAGLTAEDFELEDGGRRVPIVAFEAIDVHAPAPPQAPAVVGAEGEPPVAVQAAAHRQFLILFDMQFSPPRGVLRARGAALQFVQQSLGPSDLVAVATYGRTGLKMLTSFTTDRRYVERAIEGLGLVPSLEGGSDPLNLTGAFESDTSGNPIVDTGSARLDEALTAEADLMRADLKRQYASRVMGFLATLDELAGALSALGGRKQIILLSGGFSDAAWESPTFNDSWQDPHYLPIRASMADLFRDAGRSDVVIHSIDVHGLDSPSSTDLSGLQNSEMPQTSSNWNARPNPGRGTMAALAENTGGRFVLPTNDLGRALEEVNEVSRQYYVLAFQPREPQPKPGHARGLDVKVRRSGLTVSHRASYVLPAPASSSDTAALRLAAAEAVAKGLSGGLLKLDLETLPYRDRRGGTSLPAVLHVDGSAFAASGSGRGHPLDVTVYGYAVAQGRVVDSLSLNLSIDPARLDASQRADGLRVVTAFSVPPGTLDLRFFVRAGTSGPTGSIRRAVEVPTFAEDQPTLSPAMATLPLEGRVVALGKTQAGPGLEIPFRLGSSPFLPEAIVLESGRAQKLCVFARGAADGLVATAEMARPGGPALPVRIEGPVRRVPDPDGFDRYVLTVVPPEASAGEYALRLSFQERGTEVSARSETRIWLENP